MAKAAEQARAGSDGARRFVFEYTVGKPRTKEMHTSFELPPLDGVAACAAASSLVAAAVADGALSIEEGRALSELLTFSADHHRLAELEEAIQELQAQIGVRS